MRLLILLFVGLAVTGATLDLGGCAETPAPTDKQSVLANFEHEMLEAVKAERRFPYGAMETGAHGAVTVDFDYTPGGKADNLEITSSSGDANLDHAALMAVYFAKLPPEPPELKGITRFKVTIGFGMD
jgi:TonB family protein